MNKIKKLSAVLSAFIIAFSFTACNGNKQTETTTQNNTSVSETEEYRTFPPVVELTKEETATVAETEPETTAEPTTAETTTEKTTVTTTKKAETTTKKATTTKKTTTTKKETTTKKITAPSSKADIVKLYNSAASTAASKKPGYKKSTETKIDLEMGALASISAVRDAIGSFLGEGSSSSTLKKGSFDGKSLVKSSLKSSDVSSASCTLSDDGKYYTVKMTVINETNPKKSGSALGRFTKDFKDIDEIKAGLSDVGASADSITVKTTSVTITAKINAENNRFISIEHNINMSATMNGVKYTFVKVNKASAELKTKVKYTDFKY